MIDSHFPLAPFWALCSLVNEVSAPQGEVVSLDRIESKTGRLQQGEGDSTANGRQFRKDDVLFGKLRPYLAKYWLADRPGTAQGDIHVYRPTFRTDPRFLAYIVGSDYFTGLADTSSTGSKMPRVEWPKVAQFRVPCPSRGTQRVIADYLDRETAEIDAMSADLDEMESLLIERRGSIIRAYLLPDGQQYTRMKLIATVSLGKTVQSRQNKSDEVQRNYVRAAHIQPHGCLVLDEQPMWFTQKELELLSLRAGDVLVVEGGAGYGRSVVLKQDMPDWGFQNHVIRVRPNTVMSIGFLDMESGVFLDKESMEFLDTSSGLWLWPACRPGFG